MYMDNNKLFAKNEKELETLIYGVRIYSQDIGKGFDIEKCALLIMKRRKRHRTEGIELLNQEKNQNTQRKRNLQIQGKIRIGRNRLCGNNRKVT